MAGIVNMIANMLVPAKTAVAAPVRTSIKTEAMNPYANPFVSVKGSNPFANYQYSTIQPAPTPEPRDTSGLDILRNSYF